MIAVWKKEVHQYMVSIVGAVFLASYGGLIGYYFIVGNLFAMNGEVADLFGNIYSTLIILIPILTMRLFSEEKKMRTDQLLFTSPVSINKIVLGKFFAACQIFLFGSFPILLAVAILAFYGNFQLLETVGCFAGLFLAGSALISIGLFSSSMTENQVVSAIVSYLIMTFLWALDYLKYYIQNFYGVKFLEYFSFQSHFNQFSLGIFNFSSLVYFTSLTILMLGATQITLENRRYK